MESDVNRSIEIVIIHKSKTLVTKKYHQPFPYTTRLIDSTATILKR